MRSFEESSLGPIGAAPKLFRRKRFLVLGGQGQLGRELQCMSKSDDIDMILMGKREADVTDRNVIRRAVEGFAPDVVVNAAAYTQVDEAESQQEAAWNVNCIGAGFVATACAAAGIPLIHISTDYVFDGEKRSPYTETDLPGPLCAYGLSKEAGERAVRSSWSKHVILRTGWLYGRHGRNFLKMVMKLAVERDKLWIVSDQLGNPTTTEDLATGIMVAGSKVLEGSGLWGTYHFAGCGAASRYEFARGIVRAQAAVTGRHPVVAAIQTTEYPTLAKRPPNSRLDSSRFYSSFGMRARSWETQVSGLVEAVFHDVRT